MLLQSSIHIFSKTFVINLCTLRIQNINKIHSKIGFTKKALINRAFNFGGRDGTRTRLGSAEMTGITLLENDRQYWSIDSPATQNNLHCTSLVISPFARPPFLLERIEQKSTSKVLYCRCNGSSPHCAPPPWISHFQWSPCNTTSEIQNTDSM